ncbi:hypothetical protein H0H81_007829 [Sphagnurus paluster]|uniref:Uncharacterized protein n=1 Tax=Sphagnurus paluster TaxID=117069 RepID=A0A9P7K525_9AGAR|nr:hypothetical protein H0H81_007829 [Sphagnurus paluster]
MPAELPGFYWDAERNRYFPLSSKPKQDKPAPQQSGTPRSRNEVLDSDASTGTSLKRTRGTALWNPMNMARHAYSPQRRLQAHRRQPWLVIHLNPVVSFNTGSGPRSVARGPQLTTGIGDIIYMCVGCTMHVSILSMFQALSSFVNSATCFGPSAKISVQDLNVTGRTSLLSLNAVHDIWSSHLQDTALVLGEVSRRLVSVFQSNQLTGVNKKAVYLPDIDLSMTIQSLETHSDVFSAWQHEYMIYTGCRNGTIMRFDKRMGKHGQKLFNDRFLKQQRSSVLHLQPLNSSQLLTSHMNGDLMTFDLRFTRQATPLVKYGGHTNTYTHRLGIALDPEQQFLFAAGEDNRVRGWSVETGAPLLPSSMPVSPDDRSNPFAAVFPGVVEALQVTSEPEGTCLWAACDQQLYQFYLGQRGH